METEATPFFGPEQIMKKDEFHIVQMHKPFKTKDGYTVSTLRVVSGPKPAENKWETSEKSHRSSQRRRNQKKF